MSSFLCLPSRTLCSIEHFLQKCKILALYSLRRDRRSQPPGLFPIKFIADCPSLASSTSGRASAHHPDHACRLRLDRRRRSFADSFCAPRWRRFYFRDATIYLNAFAEQNTTRQYLIASIQLGNITVAVGHSSLLFDVGNIMVVYLILHGNMITIVYPWAQK